MENKLTFTAEYFLRGERTQSQLYTKTLSERVVSVHQESIFRLEEEKNFKFECSFTINPDGYSRAEIKLFKNGEFTSFRVRKIDENKLEIYHNSVFKEIIETDKNETILFDGPNPAFDDYNFVYFVSSIEDESIQKSVYFLDWCNGRILRENYLFLKTGNKVYIKKNNNYNEDSIIEFWDDSYTLKKITTKSSTYFFNFDI